MISANYISYPWILSRWDPSTPCFAPGRSPVTNGMNFHVRRGVVTVVHLHIAALYHFDGLWENFCFGSNKFETHAEHGVPSFTVHYHFHHKSSCLRTFQTNPHEFRSKSIWWYWTKYHSTSFTSTEWSNGWDVLGEFGNLTLELIEHEVPPQ